MRGASFCVPRQREHSQSSRKPCRLPKSHSQQTARPGLSPRSSQVALPRHLWLPCLTQPPLISKTFSSTAASQSVTQALHLLEASLGSFPFGAETLSGLEFEGFSRVGANALPPSS